MACELKFNENGKFDILLFGDLHENNDLSTPKRKAEVEDMLLLMETSLKSLKPDLVILLGDIFGATNKEEYRKVFNRCLKPVIDRNIPLAYVNGNHDHEHETSIYEMLEVFQEYENCIAFNATPDIENSISYFATIKGSNDNKDKFNLWFIDSNNLADDGDYDWVHDDQIEWYENVAAQLKKENDNLPLPALLFQHMPVPEEYELLRPASLLERPVAVQGHGIRENTWYVLKEGVKGYLGEGPCPPSFNNGQFDSWKKTGDILGAFFGHDHMNDFEGFVDGIYLAQNKLAGFKPYTDGGRSGVRLVSLDENNPLSFSTEMFYFKDFGLKSKSLGPIESWLTDRQSINLTKLRNVALGAAAVGIGIKLISGIVKKRR